MRTKLYTHKYSKAPGNGGHDTGFIPKQKVPLFISLFEKVREHFGNYEKARNYIGLADGTMSDFKKGKLSTASAKKILYAFNSLVLNKKLTESDKAD